MTGRYSFFVSRSLKTLLAAFACAALLSCGGSSSSPAAPSTPAPTPTPTPSSGATTVTIPIGASSLTTTAYAPNPATIAVGSTVTWVNNDTTDHTSTSTSNLFDSGNLPAGGRYSYTFKSAGSFQYYCIYHPGMVGTVNVQ